MKIYLKKVLAILICVTLVMSVFPSNLAFADEAGSPNGETNLLADPGFEAVAAPLEWNGWGANEVDGVNVSFTKDAAHSGNEGLKLYDQDGTNNPSLLSDDCFSVKSGDKIDLSAWVKVINGTAKLSIFYMDADWNTVTGPDLDLKASDYSDWTKATFSTTVPDTAVYACIYLRAQDSQVTAYYDDITMDLNGQAVTLRNPGFETQDTTTMPNWTRDDGATADNLSVTSEETHNGSKSLKLYDPGADCAPWLWSDTVDVKSGYDINLSAWVKVINGTAEMSIKYIHNDNSVTYKDMDLTQGDWSLKTITDTVPKDVSKACVFIWSGNSAAATAYYDDVALTQSVHLVPNVLINYNCSNLKNLQDNGWMVGEPANGAYATDSTNSTGKPDGAAFKTVPDGQILFYMDSTAGVDAVDAFKVVDSNNQIGDKPWKLDLNLKINDLMKVNTGDMIEAGFSTMVNTGTKIYRINFGADGKMRIENGWGSDYASWAEQPADLHIGDGQFHNWSIEGDGKGTVTISCDGTQAAKFEGISYADSYEPGVQFINYNDGVVSDANEIYFDNIKLTTYDDENAFINNRFEGDVNQDGTILGWRMDDGATSDNFSIDNFSSNDGQKCLKLYDTGSGCSPWLFSNTIDVTPGENIQLSSLVKVTDGTAELSLYYLDNSGNTVSTKDLDLPSSSYGNWSLAKLSKVVPAGAAKACAFIWSGNAAQATAYYDNVQFTQLPSTGVKVGSPVNLGPMVMAGNAADLYSITAKNPVTNDDELYTVSTGSESKSSIFYAIDPFTGNVLFQQEMTGTVHDYGIVQGSDKNIYVAGCDDGKLYRYTPGASGKGKLEVVGTNPSYSWIWDLAASNDGKIYGSTYDTSTGRAGEIFEYDIAAGKFTNLGSVKDGASYVRGIGVTDDYIYAGVGMPDALIKINRKDFSQKTEIAIPEYNGTPGTGDSQRMCGNVWAYNGKLFVRDNAMKLFILDEKTDTLVNTISFVQAISAPSPYNSNIIYYEFRNANKQYVLWQYDCSTNTTKEVAGDPYIAPTTSNTSNGFNWFTPTTGVNAGKHLLGITDDMGGYAVYDPINNTCKTVRLGTTPQAVDIQSIEKGPDGKLYIGGYMHGASIYDINTNTIENTTPIIDQPEGIGFLNGKAYFGTYGSAVIYRYDPTKPFDYKDNGTGNPSLAYDIGNDQDRPFVLTSGDNKLFVGTIPDYGKLGGALTIYNSKANKWTEYPNVVTDQSIVGLAYKDGMLYGGTSIYGGLGINPTQDTAKLFVWDVEKGKKVKEISLNIPGLDKPQLIGSLSFGPDGNLYGIADGAIFVMDPLTNTILRSNVLSTVDYSQSSTWRPYYIRWGSDGLLYTTIGRNIVAIDPNTLASDTLASGVSLATLGDDGNIYYASGSDLMELPVTSNDTKSLAKVVISANANINKTCGLTISAKLADGTDADLSKAVIQYFTDNSNVVSVNNKAITGLSVGSADVWVKVTLDGKTIQSNNLKVTVTQAASSFTVDTKSYTMAPKDRYVIGVKLVGLNSKDLLVSSSDSSIAAVTKLSNGNYMVTGKKAGVAYIKFTIGDKSLSVKITVQNGVKKHGESERLTVAFIQNSLTVDTKSYTMAPKDKYVIGVKLIGLNSKDLLVSSTDNKIVTVTKTANGNCIITGRKAGVAYIKFKIGGKSIFVRIIIQNRTKKHGESGQLTVTF